MGFASNLRGADVGGIGFLATRGESVRVPGCSAGLDSGVGGNCLHAGFEEDTVPVPRHSCAVCAVALFGREIGIVSARKSKDLDRMESSGGSRQR